MVFVSQSGVEKEKFKYFKDNNRFKRLKRLINWYNNLDQSTIINTYAINLTWRSCVIMFILWTFSVDLFIRKGTGIAVTLTIIEQYVKEFIVDIKK